jgi:hypothetical protein
MKKPYLFFLVALLGSVTQSVAEVTIKEVDSDYQVHIDNKLFTAYKVKDLRVPCFYPLHGPDEVPMTRAYPVAKTVPGEAEDHPHHTSLWYSHGDVNGLDFWHGGGKAHPEKGGKIVHTEVVSMNDGEDRATLKVKNKWLSLVGDKEICQDERAYAFGVYEGNRYLDFQITIKATQGDVVFGDTKEGTMAIRTHANLRLKGDVANGNAVNSEGDKDKDLWGKASKWVDYWGKVGEKEVGVAIFDHPKNPRYPTTWHARDYGLVAANPFGYSYFFKGEGKKGTLTIKSGESVTFRYGFLFHPGGHDADKLKAVYDLFSQTEAE